MKAYVFIYDLINDALRASCNTMEGWVVNDEWKRMWKEAIMDGGSPR
jgi:hypothetical protein